MFFCSMLFSQDCDTPVDYMTCDEATACILGEFNHLEGFVEVMGSGFSSEGPSPLCPNGGEFQNTSWFAFVAGSNDISFDLVLSNCDTIEHPPGSGIEKTGIQYGLYSDCTFGMSIVCEPRCVNDPVNFIQLPNLTVGETYFFFIDGCGASACTYEFVNVVGGGPPPPPVEPDSLLMARVGHWDPDGYPTTGGSSPLQYNDVWGYTTSTGEEYALLGNADSILVIDVTDCTAPERVYGFDGGNTVTWRDFKTYEDYMYAVCDGCNEGLHIFDLSALPDGDVTHELTTTSFWTDMHNIYIDEEGERLYAVHGSNQTDEVVVLDLSVTPEDPTLIGEYDLNAIAGVSGGFHIHDIYVKNDTAYCSHGYDGYFVYDFTDLNNIDLLGYVETGAYNHSSWISEDGAYAYYAEEVPTGQPMGVIDLANINTSTVDLFIEGTFQDNLEPNGNSTPHNPYVLGDYLYISYYEDGTKVYDLTDPANPILHAYYDTYDDNGDSYTGYEGNWGNYPFLGSGCILSSDITYGLNLLQLDWGNTDTCTPLVELDGSEGTGTYSASSHLHSEGALGSTEDVLYKAELSVELKAGFEVPADTDFEVIIEECEPNSLPASSLPASREK